MGAKLSEVLTLSQSWRGGRSSQLAGEKQSQKEVEVMQNVQSSSSERQFL